MVYSNFKFSDQNTIKRKHGTGIEKRPCSESDEM